MRPFSSHFFTQILHLHCYLQFTQMPPERAHFFCGCKKAVKSGDGKISVFPRRSRLKATFRAIIRTCQRCWQHQCQGFGTQSVRQHGRHLVKPKSVSASKNCVIKSQTRRVRGDFEIDLETYPLLPNWP